MRVRIIRVAGGRALEGDAIFPPIEGKPFELIVTTSEVVRVDGDGSFETRSGARYLIELLEGPDLDVATAMARRAGQA